MIPSDDDLVTRLRARACPAGEPWTGDDPSAPHGHTDCLLYHQAAAEIERLREPSWARLMEILDAHYPADVFDGSSGDPGPTIIVLIREIERLRDENRVIRRVLGWADQAPDILDVCDGLDADTVEAALTFVIDSYRPGDLRERMADWRPRSER